MNYSLFFCVIAWVVFFLSSLIVFNSAYLVSKEANMEKSIKDLRDYVRGYSVSYKIPLSWVIALIVSFAYLIAYYVS